MAGRACGALQAGHVKLALCAASVADREELLGAEGQCHVAEHDLVMVAHRPGDPCKITKEDLGSPSGQIGALGLLKCATRACGFAARPKAGHMISVILT